MPANCPLVPLQSRIKPELGSKVGGPSQAVENKVGFLFSTETSFSYLLLKFVFYKAVNQHFPSQDEMGSVGAAAGSVLEKLSTGRALGVTLTSLGSPCKLYQHTHNIANVLSESFTLARVP